MDDPVGADLSDPGVVADWEPDIFIMPRPLGGDIKRRCASDVCLSDICLSVAYVDRA